MISVNLLPFHLRPIKRTPVPYILSVLVVLVALGAMAMLFVGVRAKMAVAQAELDNTNAQLAQLKDTVEKYNSLVSQKNQLAEKITTIDEIVHDRIIWSRQLWNLTRLVPENIWCTDISVDTKQFREQQPVLDAKTGKPVIDPQTKRPTMKEVAVNKPVLKVSGYGIPSEKGEYDMSTFAHATEDDGEFKALFRFDEMNIKDTEFESFPVRQFTFEYLITPGGAAK